MAIYLTSCSLRMKISCMILTNVHSGFVLVRSDLQASFRRVGAKVAKLLWTILAHHHFQIDSIRCHCVSSQLFQIHLVTYFPIVHDEKHRLGLLIYIYQNSFAYPRKSIPKGKRG